MMRRTTFIIAPILALCLVGCSAMEAVLDYPMSFFDDDSGTTVETTVGDAVADNADGIAGLVTSALGGVSPLVALLGGGAAATMLGRARRKKKAVAKGSETKG